MEGFLNLYLLHIIPIVAWEYALNLFMLLTLWQDWSGQDASSIASEICGFITVLSGTIILHATREQETASATGIKLDWTLEKLITELWAYFGDARQMYHHESKLSMKHVTKRLVHFKSFSFKYPFIHKKYRGRKFCFVLYQDDITN